MSAEASLAAKLAVISEPVGIASHLSLSPIRYQPLSYLTTQHVAPVRRQTSKGDAQ